MNWLKNLRLKVKLILSFSIVIVFVIAMGVTAIVSLNQLDDSYTYVLEFPEKRLEDLILIESGCVDLRRISTAVMLNFEDKTVVENYWTQFKQTYDAVFGYINEYIDNNNRDHVRDAATLKTNNEVAQTMKKNLEDYKTQAGIAETLSRGRDLDATNAAFLAAVPYISEVSSTINGLVVKAGEYITQVSDDNTNQKIMTEWLLIIIIVVVAVLSAVIAMLNANIISKPVNRILAASKQAGDLGDLQFSAETINAIREDAKYKDEIGQMAEAFVGMMSGFLNKTRTLTQVAGGNLAAEAELVSSADTIGNIIVQMTDSLNAMFGEVNTATEEVSTGAKQIANASQMLAQGSTEQAAAVERLSSSIGEVAAQTGRNAGIAKEAADLSATIRSNAEKGAAQMNQMMRAVEEINEASKNINNVIKVIDNIAFQTNILALNAAVEAARAGQHGRGFAVVAEEVRNLAAKSADAAAETAGLIENSVQKANLGLSIATETSASLHDIVDGIKRSADIALQIAKSSDEQADAIAQINSGIEQVAQVVQQNSATAQESAAASEEMSGQADLLENLMSRFTLRNTHYGVQSSQKKRIGTSAKQTAGGYGEEYSRY